MAYLKLKFVIINKKIIIPPKKYSKIFITNNLLLSKKYRLNFIKSSSNPKLF